MPYLSLMSARSNPFEPPADEEEAGSQHGPIFGPVPFVNVHQHDRIELGAKDAFTLYFAQGLVYYAGRFYGEWSVFEGPPLPDDARRLAPFDPDQAKLPEPLAPYECKLPGYFHCGVPGVIAHLENGRLRPDAKVERCDQCQRYPDDDAARQKMSELDLVWQHELHLQRYTVHLYATVRITYGELEAPSYEAAARMADELFDWDQHRNRAEFADEITEYLVDRAGDVDYSHSRRFDADFEEVRL